MISNLRTPLISLLRPIVQHICWPQALWAFTPFHAASGLRTFRTPSFLYLEFRDYPAKGRKLARIVKVEFVRKVKLPICSKSKGCHLFWTGELAAFLPLRSQCALASAFGQRELGLAAWRPFIGSYRWRRLWIGQLIYTMLYPASAEGPLSCDCVNLWPSGKLSHGGQHEVSMRSVEPKFLPRASSSPVGLGFVPY